MTSDSIHFSRAWSGMAALMAMLASLPVQASDQVLASASASLTNLQIQVIDLDPSDGIAPSVSFVPGVLLGERRDLVTHGSEITQAAFDLNALPTTAWTDTVGAGTYSFSSSALSLVSELRASDLAVAAYSAQYPGTHMTGTAKSLHFEVVEPLEGFNYRASFIMGANTAVIISGNAATTSSAAASTSSGELAVLFDPAVSDVSELTSFANSGATVRMSLASLDGRAHPDGYNNQLDLYSFFELDADGTGSGHSADSPFSFSLENASFEAKSDAFTLRMSAMTSMTVLAADLPAIPEPSTCALMGLGLAGIALARCRTRRQA